MMVMISELINRLEEFKDKHGDLPVYITNEFLADTEVDMVAHVRAGQCLLGNHYLDHYSARTESKINELEEDMLKYARGHLDCTHCEWYDKEEDMCIDYYSHRVKREKYLNGEISSYEETYPLKLELKPCDWKPENVFTCFEERNHVKDEPIYRMKIYHHILKKRLKDGDTL